MTEANGKPKADFSEDEARVFIGKHVLVGITRCNEEGTAVSQEQFHGVIDRISLEEGIVIKLKDSEEERTLPPDVSRMQRAAAGEYRLRSTGEVVKDPDYITTWTIYPRGYKA